MADDDSLGAALGAATLAVGVALAVSLGVAIGHARRAPPPAAAVQALPQALQEVEAIVFGLGSPALPADAQPVIDRVAEAARADGARQVLITAFIDPTRDVADEAAAAQARAQAVAHALQADGVAPSRLAAAPPQALAAPDAAAVLRVELRLR